LGRGGRRAAGAPWDARPGGGSEKARDCARALPCARSALARSAMDATDSTESALAALLELREERVVGALREGLAPRGRGGEGRALRPSRRAARVPGGTRRRPPIRGGRLVEAAGGAAIAAGRSARL